MSIIINKYEAVDTSDGDGVQLKRVFGYYQKEVFDPFLLLDHADMNYPQTGFPWHPHRGIETITYLAKGKAYHEDSLGNMGVLNDGDIQWMKSGSGILHQEFPDKDSEHFELLQFWLNMPASEKMTEPEYVYTNVLSDNVVYEGDTKVSVIAGSFKDVQGPVQKQDRKIRMLYSSFTPGSTLTINRQGQTNAFIYVLKGNGSINGEEIKEYTVYKLKEEPLKLISDNEMSIIFAEGVPLNENIEWWGPIVMNTREEIRTAQKELNNGTFLKHEKEN